MLWAVQISAHSACTAQGRAAELSKSSCLLDLLEHRLHDLLSQSVSAAITGALQLLPHFLRHLAADLARGLGRMLGWPGSDIGVDLPGRERQKVVLSKYPPAKPGALGCEPLKAVGGR